MVSKDETAQFEVRPLKTFVQSSSIYFDNEEILLIAERLERNPYLGLPIDKPMGAILKLQHPEVGYSSQGAKAIVLYCIDEEYGDVILIDVVENEASLDKWLSDPKNQKTLTEYGKLILRIMLEVLSGS